MPITLVIQPETPGPLPPLKLTFDGTQRVVIGRTSGCDVRLPDASVSLRHAAIEARGADFVLIDEGSTNGTYVGGVRLSTRTSRILRSGDAVRIGRIRIEVQIDRSPVTRDLAVATRDLALALVAQALESSGKDIHPSVRVVEGADLGATLVLSEDAREYVLGRGEGCDVCLADADASREHAVVVRRGRAVLLRDLGSRNGVTLGGAVLEPGREFVWRSTVVASVGRTVLALEEPVLEALSNIEDRPDEVLPKPPDPPPPPPPATPTPTQHSEAAQSSVQSSGSSAPIAKVESGPAATPRQARAGWTLADLAVMLAALVILGLSVGGILWLLQGAH